LKLDDFLYYVGGAVDGYRWKSTNKVYRLNLKDVTLRWQKVASMAKVGMNYSAAVYSGCLIVTDGYSWTKLNTTRMHQSSPNVWKSIASLHGSRGALTLVTAHEKLFAIGGTDNICYCLSSVEQSSGEDGKWKEVKSMNMLRSCFAAVSCDNFIYAIGGCNDEGNTLKSVEKYNATTDKWSFVVCMNVERREHAACGLRRKIYVIGGKDDVGNIIKTIESYDPVTEEWTVVGETKEVFGHAIVAV